MVRNAFLTPDNSNFSSAGVWRFFVIPEDLLMYIDGALGRLCESAQWEKYGDLEPDDTAERFTDILSDIMQFNPVGTIVPFVNTVTPDGLLLCDGSIQDGLDYPYLYEVIEPMLRVPGGRFRTPDLRGRFLLSESATYSNRSTGGEASHVLTEAEMPAHTHDYTPPVPNVDLEAPGAPDIIAAGVGLVDVTGVTGGGQAHNNMPPYYVVKYGMVTG